MQVGLNLPQLGPFVTGSVVREFAQQSEALGYDSVWVQDHVFYPVGAVPTYAAVSGLGIPTQYQSVLAPLELLAAVGAWTSTLKLGSSVLAAGYHAPVRLAQELATLDHLCEGRLMVGVGAGWSPEEHALFGVELDSRWARMEELIAAVKACWADDPVTFEGRFFTIPTAIVRPKPVQDPRPLLLAGGGATRCDVPADRRWLRWVESRGLTVAQVRRAIEERAETTGQVIENVHCRIMWQKPHTREDELEDTLDWCLNQVDQARAAGLAGVILDASFWTGIDSPLAWLSVPDLFKDAIDT